MLNVTKELVLKAPALVSAHSRPLTARSRVVTWQRPEIRGKVGCATALKNTQAMERIAEKHSEKLCKSLIVHH